MTKLVTNLRDSKYKRRLHDFVDNSYDITFAALLMLTIVVLLSWQVTARILGIDSTWVQETARLVNLYLVFLLFARMELEDEHIRIDFFVDKFPRTVQKILDTLTDMLVIFVAVMIIWSTIQVMIEFSHVRTPGAGIPTPVLFLSALIGMTLYALVHIFSLGSHISDSVDRVRQSG